MVEVNEEDGRVRGQERPLTGMASAVGGAAKDVRLVRTGVGVEAGAGAAPIRE